MENIYVTKMRLNGKTLDNHTPNEAIHDQKTQFEVLHLNMNKSKENHILHANGSDLVSGDHVRV